VLGSGGGGDVDVAVLQAIAALETNGAVEVVPLEALDDDAVLIAVAHQRRGDRVAVGVVANQDIMQVRAGRRGECL
jgi:hypothetical protein